MRAVAIVLALSAVGCSGTDGSPILFAARPPIDSGALVEASAPDDAAPDSRPDARVDATDAAADPPDTSEAGTICPSAMWACGSQCVDLNNDAANCGACGHACYQGQSCRFGQCSCPPGTEACAAAGRCLQSGQCCSTADCPGLETCSTPGGTCQCAAGARWCPVTGSCIGANDCCTQQDCTVAGSTCTTPGQACQCSTGGKGCPATNSCIPEADCCTSADCQPGQSCIAGACQ